MSERDNTYYARPAWAAGSQSTYMRRCIRLLHWPGPHEAGLLRRVAGRVTVRRPDRKRGDYPTRVGHSATFVVLDEQ